MTCRHCHQPFPVPPVITDTSDSIRFDLNLCADCFAKAKIEFDAAMVQAARDMKPLQDALDASTRLTAEDFNIIINTRD